MLYTIAVIQGSKMLQNLKSILEKAKSNAETRKFDEMWGMYFQDVAESWYKNCRRDINR